LTRGDFGVDVNAFEEGGTAGAFLVAGDGGDGAGALFDGVAVVIKSDDYPHLSGRKSQPEVHSNNIAVQS